MLNGNRPTISCGLAWMLFLVVISCSSCQQQQPSPPENSSGGVQTPTPSDKDKKAADAGRMTNDAVTQEFLAGKTRILSNCITCYEPNPTDLEGGIAAVEHAIENGYSDKLSAYKTLARGYEYAAYLEEDPKKSELFSSKKLQTILLMYKLAPDDPEVLENYLKTLNDKDERFSVLERITKLAPRRAESQFLFGLMLIDRRQFARGVQAIESAVENEQDKNAAEHYLTATLAVLKQNGCPVRNGKAWFEGFDQVFGGPDETRDTRMQEYMQHLKKSLDELPCVHAGSSK